MKHNTDTHINRGNVLSTEEKFPSVATEHLSVAMTRGKGSSAITTGDGSLSVAYEDESHAIAMGANALAAAMGRNSIAECLGPDGTVAAGLNGIILMAYLDKKSKRTRLRVGYAGEDGIVVGQPYKLDEDGNFVAVSV